MKLITKLILIVLFLAVTSGDVLAAPGINRKINFQGKVVNKGVGSTDGTNVTDSSYNFTFSLWTTLSAGTSIWSEVWNGSTAQVPVTSGIFQVSLGTYSTFPPSFNFNSDSLYVSINFNGDGDMSPRIQLSAVPYAFNAEKVGGLTVTDTDGILTVGTSKTITFGDNFTTLAGVGITLDQSLSTSDSPTFAKLGLGTTAALYILNAGGTSAFNNAYASGNLSIGTQSGVYKLNVVGDAFVSARLGIGATDVNFALNIGTSAVNFGGNLSVGGTLTLSSIPLGTGTTILYIDSSGVLTRGTLPPGNTYTVTNGLNMNGSAIGLGGSMSANTNIGTSSFSLSLLGLGNSQALYVGTSGYVGIGTTNPIYKLQISGDVGISTNLSVGGTVNLTGLVLGTGTTMLFLDNNGNLVQGTLPDSGVGKSRSIVISPEYPGGSLSADGSGTTSVAMTSDNTLNAAGIGWKNYYELSSTEATLQDYSVIVRVTLPSDFDTWETGSCPSSTCALEFAYQTGVGATADNTISYIVSNDTDTPASSVCSVGNTASTSWGSSGCTEAVLNDNSAPEWDAAGETAVVRIKLAAKNTTNALTRAGDIILRYKSKF